MTAILGISAFYHDSAAAIIVDGEIVAAAQEERFSRKKHDADFPTRAVRYCLRAAGLTPSELSYVGFYEKPLLKFDRLLETYLSYAPRGFRSFVKAMPQWVNTKLHIRREIRRGLDSQYRGPIVFCEHHQSHAASAFFASPFDEAAILTMDGVGEWATTTLGVGYGNRLKLTDEIRFPHSLGLLYSAFTYYTGFRVNSGEYKVMGLAPYGEPVHVATIRKHLIDIRDDGSFRLDMRYFNYCQGVTMTSRLFERLFGRPPRKPQQPIQKLDWDLAASIQAVTEEIVLKIANHLQQKSRLKQLCLAGGVALNCVANGRLHREGPFNKIWIQPASGDAGGALGSALMVWHQLLDQPRTARSSDCQHGSRLGPSFSRDEIKHDLDALGGVYDRIESPEELAEFVAGQLDQGKVVAWMQGRMEFGPRALGCRSILADARQPDMQSLLNQKIKLRESFRPFAPAVMKEKACDYFQVTEDFDSPYMMLVNHVRDDRRIAPEPLSGQPQVTQVRSQIPAVTHLDYSARIQTVDRHQHPVFWGLLNAFYQRTGCPLLVNTSFNIRGEPIVCSPADAYRCFMMTDIDWLVIENFIVEKSSQPPVKAELRNQHRSQLIDD